MHLQQKCVNDAIFLCNCVTHFGTGFLIFDKMIFLTNGMITMNTIEENGNLHKLNGALKQKFARLTEDYQMYQEGLQQEIFGKLQVRYGKTEEELDMIIATL